MKENSIITVTVYVLYRKQDVINKRITENIVLDIGEGDKIVGIEILDASQHVMLDRLLPVKYELSRA